MIKYFLPLIVLVILVPLNGAYATTCYDDFEKNHHLVTDKNEYIHGDFVIVVIFGIIDAGFSGASVHLDIVDPLGTITTIRTPLSQDGLFEVPYVLSQESKVGEYVIHGHYLGAEFDSADFVLSDPLSLNPTAKITTMLLSPYYAGNTIVFSASESYDSDGEIVEYMWDFGDDVIGSNQHVPHAYQEPGTYCVGLIVVDDSGQSGTDTIELTVLEENL